MDTSLAAKVEQLRRVCGDEVDSQLRAGGEWGLDDATCCRWLSARRGNVKEAARDLRAHAAWRVKYVPRGRIFEEEVRQELEQNKAFLPGCDKAGRPLCLVIVKRHLITSTEVSKRHIAYSLDCATLYGSRQPGWDGKMCGIFDLRGLKMANCDLATLRNVFDLLQNHYPERLHKLWLFCAPVMFYSLWKMVYPFIDTVTREKVKFVYKEEAAAEFSASFDLSVIPPEILPGGTGRWISNAERYRLLLLEGAELVAAAVPGSAPKREAAAAAAGMGVGEEQEPEEQGVEEVADAEDAQQPHPDAALRPIEVVA